MKNQENIRDTRIDWHLKHSGVKSELAVKLALAASERGNSASHEWQAYNAKRFEAVLEQHGVAESANAPDQRP